MGEECGNCKFYEGGREAGEYGFCHRFPPTDGERPEMSAHDWCGEWETIPSP